MSEQGKSTPDRRGTFWDWPVAVILVAVVLAIGTDASPGSIVMFWFGVLALMIRRGAFTPRRRE